MLGDMPAVDMSMADGEVGIGDLEVDDDDDEDANRIDAEAKARAQAETQSAMDVDQYDDVDPLDAFMTSVKDEVKKVNAEDLKKMMMMTEGLMHKMSWTQLTLTLKTSWLLRRRRQGRRTWLLSITIKSNTNRSGRSFIFPLPKSQP
jgi:hypothetical protein